MEDFDQLLQTAHEKGLKIIVDQVLSHTSDQHEWFKESRTNRTNDKASFYVWADPKPDGTPPNNWLSIFGGGAWQFDSRREQYYLHNFLTSQPDLNFHNPQVQAAVLDNVEFWLKKGVDGFRLDAINFCFHDMELRDNPAKPAHLRTGKGFSTDNPYAYQFHYYNNTRPENLEFLEKLRSLMNKYPNKLSLGEVSSEDSLGTIAEYTNGGNKLHTAYSFELLTDDFSAKHIRDTISEFEAKIKDGFPCWAIGNHDVERVQTRWGKKYPEQVAKQPHFASFLTGILTSLRGSFCIYQGDELGLEEAHVEFQDLQDPFGIAFWPTFKGRDGCRTPMPWSHDSKNIGFSEKDRPWLPVCEQHKLVAVDLQEEDVNSNLNVFRHFIAWRKTHSALVYGSIEFINQESDTILSFTRTVDTQKILCMFNLGANAHTESLGDIAISNPLKDHGLTSGTFSVESSSISLPPFSAFFAEVVLP
mmetsp:Transcript_3216/g.6850  ORF Transcript_3216/g.6850 Transcript_3216/m.6850 type:complete len:474 (+) Transcript_3216:131-1552(+)